MHLWTFSTEPIKAATAILTFVGLLGGGTYQGVTAIDRHYAHQEDLVLIELRLGQKITSDRIYQMREELFQIERQYPNGLQSAPEAVRERYTRLKAELEDALRERDQLIEQMRQKR